MNVTRMCSGHSSSHWRGTIAAAFVLVFIWFLPACKSKTSSSSEAEPQVAPANSLELVFTYGSEKEKWINEVTAEFNRGRHRSTSGKRIFVRAIPMGSGEAIDEV